MILKKKDNSLSKGNKFMTIYNCFHYWVNKTPDAVAVIFKDQKITYKQLDAMASISRPF